MRRAEWIWLHDGESKDEYVQFLDEFESGNQNVVIKIACDTDYIVYVNGKVAAYGQYAAFPKMAVYDEIDVSSFAVCGKNELAVLVWHWGVGAMVRCVKEAGLWYEVCEAGKLVAYSSEKVLCRLATDYVSGFQKSINTQQGLSYCYKASGSDEIGVIRSARDGYKNAVVKNLDVTMYPRPNEKLVCRETSFGVLIDAEKRIYDLGCERAGILHIEYRAPAGERFAVVFGEYVQDDGNLMRRFEHHDYSVYYEGNGDFVEHVAYLKRIGCRYLQVVGDHVEIKRIGLKETEYPVTAIPVVSVSDAVKRIYDVSVRTLQLCMHEHFEDCPWREQVLYIMDSRNAMLSAYEAFGDLRFAKSNLWLISFSPLMGGLLPASAPSEPKHSCVIPIYNLVYIIHVYEYLQRSGDVEFVRTLVPLMEGILSVFESNKRDGLVAEFEGCWNFCEWTPELTGHEPDQGKRISLALNAFYILALSDMDKIYSILGEEGSRAEEIAQMQKLIAQKFYLHDEEAFTSYVGKRHVSSLVNALAVLCGAAKAVGGDAEGIILDKIVSEKLGETSLAMKPFLYDALLTAGETYKDFILSDILRSFGYMLDRGATSFWETLEGEKQYGGAGSLCHAWSAISIVYLRRIGGVSDAVERKDLLARDCLPVYSGPIAAFAE